MRGSIPSGCCARRDRPRRHSAEKRDELAPFHCSVPLVLPNKRNSTHGTAGLRDFSRAYARVGARAASTKARLVRFSLFATDRPIPVGTLHVVRMGIDQRCQPPGEDLDMKDDRRRRHKPAVLLPNTNPRRFVVKSRPRLAKLTNYPELDFAAYERRLASLQCVLQLIQQAYLGSSERALIVLEGWDTAGKGGVVRRLGWSGGQCSHINLMSDFGRDSCPKCANCLKSGGKVAATPAGGPGRQGAGSRTGPCRVLGATAPATLAPILKPMRDTATYARHRLGRARKCDPGHVAREKRA